MKIEPYLIIKLSSIDLYDISNMFDMADIVTTGFLNYNINQLLNEKYVDNMLTLLEEVISLNDENVLLNEIYHKIKYFNGMFKNVTVKFEVIHE